MELYKHNRKHYDALMAMLETGQRACGIQPPGTGKSFIAFNIALEHSGESMLWMSPNEYIFSEQMESFKRNCPGDDVSNIEQMTYAAAMARAKDGRELPCGFDWIVLDEFHHCLAPEWGKGVQAVLDANPQAKIVGLTATEIRYSDGGRDASEELFGGNVAFRMGIQEAWFRGILPIPTYITALYRSPSELGELEVRVGDFDGDDDKKDEVNEAYQKLRRRVREAKGVGEVIAAHLGKPDARLIVFCPNAVELDEIAAKRGEWFGRVNRDVHAYKVHCGNPQGEVDYDAFREDDSEALKVLYCIDQLNEGVHIEGVGGVVMVRATSSPTIFQQQLGRALDAGRSKNPLVFDLVNNVGSLGLDMFGSQAEGAFERLMEDDPGAVAFTPDDLRICDEVKEIRELAQLLQDALRPEPLPPLDEMVAWLIEHPNEGAE